MAKIVALFAFLCVLSFFGSAYSRETLDIKGTIYCDTCRALFQTHVSELIEGAKVRLECRDRENINNVTLDMTATTDKKGAYTFDVVGDHDDEICDVSLVSSPDKECDEIPKGLDKARILISDNDGISNVGRFVNPLGFLRKNPIKGCDDVLKSLGILPEIHQLSIEERLKQMTISV